MTESGRWVDRRFQFTLPAELHPNQRARLRGTPARLDDVTRDLPEAVLTMKLGGAWSIKENVGHLLDLEKLWQTRVDQFIAGAQTLAAADMENRKTHEANHNARPLDDLLAEFRATRLAWLAQVDGLAPDDFVRTAQHPRLGVPIRLVDHLFFVAEHDDHHLARIWELRRTTTRPAAGPAMPATQAASEARRQATRSFAFTASSSFEHTFPLFGPVREAEWEPAWAPVFVHPPGGSNDQPGTVFVTAGYTPGSQRIWVMTDHDSAAGLVRYVTIQPGHSTAEIQVHVRSLGADTCQVTVTYRRTGLSAEGNGFVDAFAAGFEQEGPHWEAMVNRRLRQLES